MFIVNVEGAVRENDRWLIIVKSKKEEHAGGLLSLVGVKVKEGLASSDVLEKALRRGWFKCK